MLKAVVNNKTSDIEFSDLEKSSGLLNGTDFRIDHVLVEEGTFHVIKEHRSYVVRVIEINKEEKTIKLKINGSPYKVHISSQLDQLIEKFGFEKKVKKVDQLVSSMPGKVIKLLIKAGEIVEENQPVLILEAMKMENMIKSPIVGEILSVEVTEGSTINKGDILLKYK